MEKINERVDIVKVLDFIIENIIKLIKKGKINQAKIVFKNDIIHIDMDNCIYTISNVMMYKRFTDKVSYKYKILLKYLPKINDNLVINNILIKYYKNKEVTVLLNEKKIDIS